MTDLLSGVEPGDEKGPTLQAATVVLLRNGEGGGPECLMVRKTQGQVFGGLWVFPGGKVEPGDGTGLQGARRAAVREAAEEIAVRLDAEALVPLSHWEPPPQAPKRYLTWFFVASLPDDAAEVVVDGGEIGDHVWTAPDHALEAHRAREIDLLPPTWVTLYWLAAHSDVASGLRAAADRPAERFATRIVDDEGTPVALWAPDGAYPVECHAAPGPLDTGGPRHRLYMGQSGWVYQRSLRSSDDTRSQG